MKYISSKVWIWSERIMLVYIQASNKRTRSRIKIRVGDLVDHHSCLRCPYNAGTCNMMCQKLEEIPELKEKIKEEFGIIIGPKITPLFIERLNAKW